MPSVSFRRPLTLRPVSLSTQTCCPSAKPRLAALAAVHGDRVGERIEPRRFVEPRILHGEAVGVHDVAVVEAIEVEARLVAAMRAAGQEIRQRLVIFQRDLEAARLGDGGDLSPIGFRNSHVDRHAHVDERAPIDLLRLLLPLDDAVLLEPVEAALGAEIVLQFGVADLLVGVALVAAEAVRAAAGRARRCRPR